MSKQDNRSMKGRKTAWRLLAKSLGEKSGKNDSEADKIALIRLFVFLSIFITNCFIVAGVIRHWNDYQQSLKCANLSEIKLGSSKVYH